MKAVFVSFNQAHLEDVNLVMLRLGLKGFTGWETVIGTGSNSGEPHLGSHAWPTLNSAYMVMVPDELIDSFFAELKKIDEGSHQLGLRAFCWTVERTL